MIQKQKSKKSGGVTMANIFSIIGLATFGILTYLGLTFSTGGNINFSIILSAIYVVVAAVLVFGAAGIRGNKLDTNLWKIVEIVMIVAYVAFAAFTYEGFLHFFNVTANSSSVRSAAERDIIKVRDIFARYEQFEEGAIASTQIDLLKTVSGAQCDPGVVNFKAQYQILTAADVREFIENTQTTRVLGTGYSNFKAQQEQSICEWETMLANWDVLHIPTLPNHIEALANNVVTELDSLSAKAVLPRIDLTDKCTITVANQVVSLETPTFELRQAMKPAGAMSVLGIALLVLVHLLIALTYIVAPSRKSFVPTGKATTVRDGGRTL